MARRFSLPSQNVLELDRAALGRIPRLFVDLDLTDPESIEAFRRAMGRPAEAREWVFVVEQAQSHHRSDTQANALFSTHNIVRAEAAPLLRRRMSIAGRWPEPISGEAALLAAPGGVAVRNAGNKLAELFDGLSRGERLTVESVSSTGAEVIRSITETGASNWLDTVRDHHEGTFQHCLLVAGVAAAYAAHNLKGTRMADRLIEAAMLHDIGKANIPLHVLDKPGRLTEDEFALIQRHPAAARDYLAAAHGLDPEVLDAVVHHHEALDGTGYPDRLRDRDVRPLARVLTVCDIFAALVERRTYKPPLPPEDAIAILVDKALGGKVDYSKVRGLAAVFRMTLPATLDEVIANMRDAASDPA